MLACGGIATRGGYDEGGMNGGAAHGGQGTSVAGRSRGGTMTTGGATAVMPSAGATSASGGAATATAGTTSASGGATMASASAGSGASMAGSFPIEMPMGPAACYKDTDCPGAACGGEVCNWNKLHPMPEGERLFMCNPAGTSPQGQDGWCVSDADCKCRGLGAVCVAPYCSFTC